MMYFLLISCALLVARSRLVLAAPSVDDITEQSNLTLGTKTEVDLRNTEQQGCPCSDHSNQRPAHLEPYSRNMMVHGMMCMCNLATMHGIPRDDYHYAIGIGSYKLHSRIATWNEARKICNEEGGHLAIINSMAEERVSDR
jgi:hypothetical protein